MTNVTSLLAARTSRAEGVGTRAVDPDLQAACVAACVRAATVCTVSADGCLGDPSVADLRDTIRLALDCADVCHTTATVLSRHVGEVSTTVRRLLEACVEACARSAAECERLADAQDHCRRSAEETRRCERACRALLD